MQHEGMWRHRPAAVWMLVLLDVVGGALCAYAAIAPATPRSPTTINAIAAAVVAGLATLLWFRGRGRTPWVLVHTNVVVYLTAGCVIVANAATGEGALSVASCFLLVAMYLGIVFPRPVARMYLVAVVVGLGVALAASTSVAFSPIVWLPPTLSIIAVSEVLSVLTRSLRDASRTDHLTGLYNRNGFDVIVDREIAAAARTGAPLTLAVVDLDGFKQVNDRDGHAAGDRLLRTLADGWRAGLRPRDRVCRTGGDEFTFVLPSTDEAGARVIMDRLRAATGHAWSFGVSSHRPGEPTDVCIARADEALYADKHRNRLRSNGTGS